MQNVLVSDDIIESFRVLYDEGSKVQWITGDYIVDVVDELAPLHGAMLGDDNQSQAFHRARASIIRQLAIGVGSDVTTLYDREGMSRFYPVQVRKEYDALTYHQLRACKSAGEDWKRWADWAIENLPASVAMIRARIKADNQTEKPEVWVGRWERIIVLAGAIRDDPGAPQRVRQICGGLLRTGITLPGPGANTPLPP